MPLRLIILTSGHIRLGAPVFAKKKRHFQAIFMPNTCGDTIPHKTRRNSLLMPLVTNASGWLFQEPFPNRLPPSGQRVYQSPSSRYQAPPQSAAYGNPSVSYARPGASQPVSNTLFAVRWVLGLILDVYINQPESTLERTFVQSHSVLKEVTS